jgi:hypothetical protein
VPVLAKGKTDTGRLWIYVRDDKPFGGAGPPAAIFHYSRDRRGEHPQAHLIGYAGGRRQSNGDPRTRGATNSFASKGLRRKGAPLRQCGRASCL